jgi:hypothetical protein
MSNNDAVMKMNTNNHATEECNTMDLNMTWWYWLGGSEMVKRKRKINFPFFVFPKTATANTRYSPDGYKRKKEKGKNNHHFLFFQKQPANTLLFSSFSFEKQKSHIFITTQIYTHDDFSSSLFIW